MKTKVFKQVKKQIAVFASVCIVAGLALTYVACSADEMTAEQRQAEEQFKEDLLAFNNQQQQLLDNLRGTRATTGELTQEEYVAVGKRLGENMDAFVVQHSDLLKEYAPKQEITEEDLEMMKIDQDAFLDYIEENMSQDCYTLISDATSTPNSISVSNLQQYDLNPFESMCVSNMATFGEFGEIYEQSFDNQKTLTKKQKDALNKCWQEFKSNEATCAEGAVAEGLAGTAASIIFGPACPFGIGGAWSAAGYSFAICTAVVGAKYVECRINALSEENK